MNKLCISTHSAFSILRIFHTPYSPYSSFSTLRIFHTPIFHTPHFPHSSFSILRIFHTPHFPYSSFSILLIFHTPHSALRTPHSAFSIQPSYFFSLIDRAEFCSMLGTVSNSFQPWCCVEHQDQTVFTKLLQSDRCSGLSSIVVPQAWSMNFCTMFSLVVAGLLSVHLVDACGPAHPFNAT